MPAKRRCQAQIIVSSPPLPAATHIIPNPTTNPNPSPSSSSPAAPPPPSESDPAAAAAEAPRSPGGTVIMRELPAQEATTNTLQCPHPAQRIVGDCAFCGKHYCANHRMPEHHRCVNLQACRDAAHAANRAKLESERTVARKIAST